MDLNNLINRFWKELFPDTVIHLSTYRLERSKKYPGVGFKQFVDLVSHKQWLLNETKRLQRKAHNDAVLQKFKMGVYKDSPKEPA